MRLLLLSLWIGSISLFMGGCGVKGPPLPPIATTPQQTEPAGLGSPVPSPSPTELTPSPLPSSLPSTYDKE